MLSIWVPYWNKKTNKKKTIKIHVNKDFYVAGSFAAEMPNCKLLQSTIIIMSINRSSVNFFSHCGRERGPFQELSQKHSPNLQPVEAWSQKDTNRLRPAPLTPGGAHHQGQPESPQVCLKNSPNRLKCHFIELCSVIVGNYRETRWHYQRLHICQCHWR